MRIGFTADLHLGKTLGARYDAAGVNRRSLDLEDAYRQVVDGFLRTGVDVAVIAGDVFDAARPPERARRVFVEETRRLAAGVGRVIVLAGNHDCATSQTDGTPVGTAGLALPGVEVVDAYATRELVIDGVGFTLIPWMRDDTAFLTAVDAARPPEGATHRILVLHCGLSTLPEFATMRPGSQTLTPSLVPSDRYDAIFSGHFHGHARIPEHRFTFIGSPERLSISDTAAKGFLTYATRGKRVTFHPIRTRPWYDFPPIDAAALDARSVLASIAAIRDATPDWEEALVRLRITHLRPETRAILDEPAIRVLVRSAFHADFSLSVDDPSLADAPAEEAADESADAFLARDLATEWTEFAGTIDRDPAIRAEVARQGLVALGLTPPQESTAA